MQKNSITLCSFALIMGIFGAFFRWVQNFSVFDEETGLAQPHAFWSYVVFVFLVAVAVALLFWVRSLRTTSFVPTYPQAMSLPSVFSSAGSLLVLLLMAAGSATSFLSFLSKYRYSRGLGEVVKSQTYFYLATAVLSIICALCLFSYLRSLSEKRTAKPSGKGVSAFIVIFLCYWLVAAYKYSANDPVVWHFAIHLLAISAIILAFYYLAGFSFNQPKPLFAVYFSLLGTVLAIVTIADSLPTGEKLIMSAFALSLLLSAFGVVRNASEKGKGAEPSVSEAQPL